ncbi:uroporphyrin-III methyltransferase [Mesorhizobium sp. Root157]|uniref:uroporphyrinogen-III C-methyltransferase n=1 Tax=Mesorhizobium sp. Root157 TaxID=1736477 RepID=UPI0006FF8983|nr:uroporphyrinogen-III C-methyltransferase [Mesorhizobium sp. Root157]KQZ81822.1 uroporphyrin-III methyltransferase [Mesorhizobium sp. Root157]
MSDNKNGSANTAIEQALNRLDVKLRVLEPGHVWLAGAGPGDPGLLTLDVVSALGQADALVHDALVSPEIIAVAEQAEKFFVGKRGGRLSIPQKDINTLLVGLARQGRKVVRLKGGHPYVFGRGGEEVQALVESAIPYRVLPGVTSAFGGLTSAGIPATMRGINGAIILATGFAAVSDDRPDWTALARTGQPIVIYMGLTHMAATVADLFAGGLSPDTPAALIENATLPQERTVVATLGTLVEAANRENVVSPALIVVGGIVALRAKLAGAS